MNAIDVVLTLKDEWDKYNKACYGNDPVAEVQGRETHQAFFAGAFTALTAVQQIAYLDEEKAVLALEVLIQEAKKVCTENVACYSLVFWFLLPWYLVLAILAQHWLQDRFALHLKWMKSYRQTTPDLWPVGPLCMYQSFHLAFIGIIATLKGQ